MPGESYGQRSLAGYSPCGHRDQTQAGTEHKGFSGQGHYLVGTIMLDTCRYPFAQTHRMHNTKSVLKVNYGLCVIMTSCRFINFSTCISVEGMLVMEEAKDWDALEISIHFSQFCCAPKLL